MSSWKFPNAGLNVLTNTYACIFDASHYENLFSERKWNKQNILQGSHTIV